MGLSKQDLSDQDQPFWYGLRLDQGNFGGDPDDEGNGVQGNHVDLFLNAPQAQVNRFGIQHVQVTVLGSAAPTATGSAACTSYR